MNQRPKSSALLLIAVIFLCIYLVKSFYNVPSFSTASAKGAPKIERAGARLVFGLKLDLNKTAAQDLELLPGIGPVLGARIVEERRVTGDFKEVNELSRVKGLTPWRIKSIAPYITVGG